MIVLDYKDSRPIYEQIIEKFRLLILKGILTPDTQMPSVRSLAMELSVNPNTIQKAYTELERNGYIYVVKGRGAFVAGDTGLMDEHRRECMAQISEAINQALEAGISAHDILAHTNGLLEKNGGSK